MNKQERREIVYLALRDLYHEISSSAAHLNIIQEFLSDILDVKEKGKNMEFDMPSVHKYKNSKNAKQRQN